MWRHYEEDAIYIGLDLDYYWSLNMRQFNKYIKAFNRKEQDRVKEIDRLNHMLGIYISHAFNDPKKYPKEPFLTQAKENTNKEMTAEEMEKMARFNTLKKGGQVN